MSSRPFMQLYVSDYLGDTMHLSCEQHGAYLLLLMTMWNADGWLPNEPAKLARVCRLTKGKFIKISDDIMPFFEVEGDRITHKRMKKEIQKTQEKTHKRREAGRKGGIAKSLKDKETALANASDLPCHSPDTRDHIEKEDTNVSSKNPKSSQLKKRVKSPKPKKRKTALPDGWRPKPLSAALKSKLQLTQEEYRHEFDKFTESARAHGRSYVDWDAAWRTWLQSPYGTWGKRQEAGGTGGKPKSHNDRMAENDQRRWDAWERASGPDQGYEQAAQDVGGAHDASRIA